MTVKIFRVKFPQNTCDGGDDALQGSATGRRNIGFGMMRWLIWAMLAGWVVCVGLSLNHYLQEPTGDGFTLGLDRIMGFLGWQVAAGVLTLCLCILSQKADPAQLEARLARWPAYLTLAGLLIGGVMILIGGNVPLAAN
ncbi:MAG: hypothetical protein ACI81Q_001889 [Paracoccaceae bacterium]